mmetsp:Transcript_29657/g.61723  ORF Transcript_29657/g.61723 Transcript_29657/m.61723 type:complete len:393 (-) Transcript_29657:304-1482(-)
MTVPVDRDSSASAPRSSNFILGKESPLPLVRTLFIWDFDWTIVNCNSDEYIPSQFLGDKAIVHKFREGLAKHGPTKWHEIVASIINECIDEGKCTRGDVVEAAESMPFLIDVRGALGDIDSTNDGDRGDCSKGGDDASQTKLLVGQAIVSDGNDGFIGAYLKRNGMRNYFSHGIETNAAFWESKIGDFNENSPSGGKNDNIADNESNNTTCNERLRIQYHSAKYGGHSCNRCPPNLCKSQVVNDILSRIVEIPTQSSRLGDSAMQQPYRPRIVYIGDGSNDACPALHVLNENDVLLARVGRKRRDPNSKSGAETDEDAIEGHGKHEFHPEMHYHEVEAHGAVNAFPILSTLRKAEKEGLHPKCRICVWRSGKDLRSHVRRILDETKRAWVED